MRNLTSTTSLLEKLKKINTKELTFHSFIKGEKNVPLYIKVKGCVCPFGIKQNTEIYSNKVSGYCLCHSLENNYVEKVKELDKFLINEVYENRTSWRIGEKIPFEVFSGYDDYGTDSKYKRVLKYPYRNENRTKVYELDKYLPRIDMKIITNLNTSPHKLTLDAFNENREKISNITESNCDEILPPGSIVTAIFSISRITIASYGVVLKHIVRQILIKKSTILPTDVSLLADEDDSDEIPRRPKKTQNIQ